MVNYSVIYTKEFSAVEACDVYVKIEVSSRFLFADNLSDIFNQINALVESKNVYFPFIVDEVSKIVCDFFNSNDIDWDAIKISVRYDDVEVIKEITNSNNE